MKMRKFLQNKLWRDKAPELLKKLGSVIHIKRLNDTEFAQQLCIKLVEEAREVCDATSLQELKGELADVFEVIDTLLALHNISPGDIKSLQEQKRVDRGGFTERTFVTFAEHLEDSFGEKYCLAQPEKYPEILE
jgi:predicted house-cleaning noncanonical NTP pyrophosphatase (MazG superfamily)